MKLKLLIVLLLLPFSILSLWVFANLWLVYEDIISQDFVERNRDVEWYNLLTVILFTTGISLWSTTVYYLFKKWRVKSALPVLELVYLFTSYFSFMWMLIGHVYPPFGITMLGIHICCLILLIKRA